MKHEKLIKKKASNWGHSITRVTRALWDKATKVRWDRIIKPAEIRKLKSAKNSQNPWGWVSNIVSHWLKQKIFKRLSFQKKNWDINSE